MMSAGARKREARKNFVHRITSLNAQVMNTMREDSWGMHKVKAAELPLHMLAPKVFQMLYEQTPTKKPGSGECTNTGVFCCPSRKSQMKHEKKEVVQRMARAEADEGKSDYPLLEADSDVSLDVVSVATSSPDMNTLDDDEDDFVAPISAEHLYWVLSTSRNGSRWHLDLPLC